MNTTLTIDKAGRVVLPKPVRDQMQLSAGDSLVLDSAEDRIVLRPVREAVGMRKKQGIWILDVDEPLTLEAVNRTTEDVRREREQSLLGLPGVSSSLKKKATSRRRR
jgi:AbrB family looped-hinge helix DNA binding protein